MGTCHRLCMVILCHTNSTSTSINRITILMKATIPIRVVRFIVKFSNHPTNNQALGVLDREPRTARPLPGLFLRSR